MPLKYQINVSFLDQMSMPVSISMKKRYFLFRACEMRKLRFESVAIAFHQCLSYHLFNKCGADDAMLAQKIFMSDVTLNHGCHTTYVRLCMPYASNEINSIYGWYLINNGIALYYVGARISKFSCFYTKSNDIFSAAYYQI